MCDRSSQYSITVRLADMIYQYFYLTNNLFLTEAMPWRLVFIEVAVLRGLSILALANIAAIGGLFITFMTIAFFYLILTCCGCCASQQSNNNAMLFLQTVVIFFL
jgi:hypothetical protein